MNRKSNQIERILVYRLGSLGDTIVALPSLHLIAKAFPNAERRMLCNFPINGKAAPAEAILNNSGLIQSYIPYSVGLRKPMKLFRLMQTIRKWKPSVLVYLAAPRGRLAVIRDAFFFKLCGIKTLIGVPYSKELRQNILNEEDKQLEYETSRLLRCLKILGSVDLNNLQNWDLHITEAEKQSVDNYLSHCEGLNSYFACSIGTKANVKDWGSENWNNFLEKLSELYPNTGMVFLGATDEFERSENALNYWKGPKLNLCGKLSPRESAVVMQGAEIFIGHDSGPMHLASAMGTSCVAIFSARNKPKVWFPYGNNHKVIYHQTECFGCGLEVCAENSKKCITSISVSEVINSVTELLNEK